MNSNYVIETRGLVKSFHGEGHELLSGLDMKVPAGSIYGLLGRNGTGKTTLIRIIMGLIRQDAGERYILGDDSFPLDVKTRSKVGYLSQDLGMFSWMTVQEHLDFLAPFYPNWDMGHAHGLAKRLSLKLNYSLKALSVGERQKAGLLLALAQQPKLLILDEPAASLDTVVRREFLESIIDLLVEQGATVLITSQILTDIERVADQVGIIVDGRMLVSASLDDLKESVKKIRITFEDEAPETVDLPGAIKIRHRGRDLLVTVTGFNREKLLEIENRFPGKVEVQDIDLEDIFIELVGESHV